MSRLTLRRATVDDAPLIHHWRREATIAAHQPLLPLPLNDVRELLMQRSIATISPQSHGDFLWLIVASTEPVGWVSLKIAPIDRAHGKGSIGYAIGEAHRRKGYGRAGLGALLPVVFDRSELNLERLEAVAAVENHGSRRVLEANGFQFEGIQRGLLVIRGVRVDHAMYGLLRTDWESNGREA